MTARGRGGVLEGLARTAAFVLGSVAAVAAVAAAVTVALDTPGVVLAQEVGEARGAPADTTEVGETGEADPEGPLVEAPFQFRVGPTAGVLAWEDPGSAGEQRIDDAPLWGLDVASVVGRWVGFRLGGAVGPTSIARGDDEIDAVQYLADVAVEGRLAVDPLAERGVVPYVAVGVGTVVHDPAPDSLVSRSQSTFTWGAGVEAQILERIGARAEWRRVQGELQSAFDPVDRSGSTRFAHRWFLGAYWVF